jgi:propionyl-CoA synthetase
MAPHHLQDEIQRESLASPELFWSRQAEHLHWHKKPSRALNTTTKSLPGGVSHPHWSWFPDGELNTSYNCIDRHVESGNGNNVAIVWDSPVSGSKEQYTYKQLLQEVETLAGVLREEGVRRGDVVLIYSMNALHLENPYS